MIEENIKSPLVATTTISLIINVHSEKTDTVMEKLKQIYDEFGVGSGNLEASDCHFN